MRGNYINFHYISFDAANRLIYGYTDTSTKIDHLIAIEQLELSHIAQEFPFTVSAVQSLKRLNFARQEFNSVGEIRFSSRLTIRGISSAVHRSEGFKKNEIFR